MDPERIGLCTFFGGGIVIYTATFDRRVKAVVAQVASLMNPVARQAMNPARVATLPQAGHWVPLDNPTDFARLVREFLAID
jgi:pimeloyl-ACP methyl ester carboxylesterase